ncbi:MAG: hypothetical protein H0X66_09165 [Verrucomicrobia bacterium]|nr:hypothetical protein [Verrucomicrobiota bacterium]
MHRILVSALVTGLVVQTVVGQTVENYVNSGIVTTAPHIDARNFLNEGQFYATNGFLQGPYFTYSTLNHTNKGLMESNIGFRFHTVPTGTEPTIPGRNFINENGAVIRVGGNLEIAATNIHNRGTLTSGSFGRVTLKARTADLSQSVISAGAFGFSGFLTSGIFNEYWGSDGGILGRGSYNDAFGASAFSPSHLVTNVVSSGYRTRFVNVSGTEPTMQQFVRETFDLNSGRTSYVQVAYVILPTEPDGTVGSRLATELTFFKSGGFDPYDGEFSPVGINWYTTVVHPVTGEDLDVELSFFDDFANDPNIIFFRDSSFSPTLPKDTYQPSNFDLLRFRRFFGWDVETTAALPNSPLPVFTSIIPIRYSAWAATLQANSVRHDTNVLDTASVTNLPGRIEITAGELNLAAARINAENYLSIKATNHFYGNRRSVIVSPFVDVSLRSTNSLLTLDDLIPDELPTLVGEVKAYSSFWGRNYTIDNEPYRDNFAVLIVDARSLRVGQPTVHHLKLTADHLVLNDRLNVQENLNLDCISLTISNAGHLNITSERIVWEDSLPRLTALTNLDGGVISAINEVKFMQGSQPNAPDGAPYDWFVNHGRIEVGGLTVSANNLIHSGELLTRFGNADLRFGNAALTNGTISVVGAGGGISLSGNNLIVSNTIIFADRRMTLAVAGTLNDTGIDGNNLWRSGNGFDLPVKPASGDLLGTTIWGYANAFSEVEIRWAGEDRGLSSSGFQNNAALGHLWLDGGFASIYSFRPIGAQNALYVRNLALSEEIEEDFEAGYTDALNVDPNFTIYFENLQSLKSEFGNITLEESPFDPSAFESKTGGRIRWMGAGRTAVNLRDAQGNIIGTIDVDAALRDSNSIDSDGDGIVNKDDEFPFDGPVLQTQITETGAVQLDWNAAANTTYILWCTYDFTTWEQVTEITSGSTVGLLGVQIPVLTNACTFKVSYSP